jgi:UDP-glucose 4-epimerase
MRFFVTGGAGFIGSALCLSLVAEAHEVVIYDDFSRGRRDWLPDAAGVTVVEGDIRDHQHVERAIAEAGPQRLVHLAALHFIPECIARPRDTLEINLEGTRHVLAACARHGVPAVILASSAAVYAPSSGPCRELDSPLGPDDVYGRSKLGAEGVAREFHLETGSDVAVLRIFNAIGPRETNPHVLPHLFESLRGSDTVMLGNLDARRDYIHTCDVARAILAVAARSHGLAVYNVGSGRAHSVAEIVELLRHKLVRPVTVQVDPLRLRPTDRPLLLADIKKIESELGWTPEIALEEALDELILYYGLRTAP